MMRKTWSRIVAIVVASMVLLSQTPAIAETELKAISFLPKDHKLCAMIPTWVDEVNGALKGSVKVVWVGGPEIMDGFNQPDAIRQGVFQIGFMPTAYYKNVLPEADAISMSKLDFTQERKTGGLWDYMVTLHQKINLVPLATWLYDPFYIYLSKPITKLSDIEGRKIRTSPKYDPMFKKLGIVPVTISPGETYTALQRGLVEGFGWPTIGAKDMGWLDTCKYVIDAPFYARQNTLILMNSDAWKKLPKEEQDKIQAISIKFEGEMKAYFEKQIETAKEEMEKLGVKRIKLSADDTKTFTDAADNAFWEDLAKKTDQVETLKKLTGNAL